MTSPKTLLLLVVVIAFGAPWFVEPTETSKQGNGVDDLTPKFAGSIAESNNLPTEDSSGETNGGLEAASPRTETKCHKPYQLRWHPVFGPLLIEDERRFESLRVRGPIFANYRGNAEADLRALAIQGDAEAMVVLGAVSLMRARGLSEDKGVPFLVGEEGLQSSDYVLRAKAEQIGHYEEARDWFYKAALHGRLFALDYVGYINGKLEDWPTESGWTGYKIDDASPHAFGYKSSKLHSVYLKMPYEIAPQLCDRSIRGCPSPDNDQLQAIATRLVKQFAQDQLDLNLPPIVIAESKAPPLEEIKSWICDSYLDDKGEIIFDKF